MTDPTAINLDEIAAMHNSPGALYHSLGHIIRGKIQSGEWEVGRRIPSERELMAIFNVSRATVRQAIENLEKEGVLRRERGKGTFVAPSKIEQGVLRMIEFSDIIKQSGLRPSAQLLGKDCILPPKNIRKVLNLSETALTAYLQRLLLVNGAPMLIETVYFPAERFPNLPGVYDGAGEWRDFVFDQYGVKVIRARETFEPVILEDREAGILGVKGGFPALWVEHVAYDAVNSPVVYLTSLMRGDRCRFYTDIVFDNGK